MLKIPRLDLNVLHNHLISVYPEEGCGLLLGTVSDGVAIVTHGVATQNVWNAVEELDHNKGDRYEIDPKEMLAAMKLARSENIEIIGVYHSHPDHPARPSESDRQLAWSQYIYLICSVEQGILTATTAWQLDDRQQFQAYQIEII